MGTATIETTDTAPETLKSVLDAANPNLLPSALQQAKLGTTLTPLTRTFTGLATAATYDLTALDASGETAGPTNPNRLAALSVVTLRVTAATTGATVGSYIVTDSGGTVVSPTAGANVGVAKLSDDRTTLTFPSADVTGFVIKYIPQILTTTQWNADFADSSNPVD